MTRIKLVTGASGGNGSHAASHYGARDIEKVLPSAYLGVNGIGKLNLTFSFDDLPVATLDEAALTIPANARIISATLRTLVGITGTTPTLTLGLAQKDGTAIDVDGIDVAIAAAALGVNTAVKCDGALVDSLVGIGANRGQIVATTGGTVTAGKFALEVVYELLTDRSA